MYSFDKKLREISTEADAAQSTEELQAIREKFETIVSGMFASSK